MYDILELNDKLVSELKEIAKKLVVPGYEALRKQDLIYKILDQQALTPGAAEIAAAAVAVAAGFISGAGLLFAFAVAG